MKAQCSVLPTRISRADVLHAPTLGYLGAEHLVVLQLVGADSEVYILQHPGLAGGGGGLLLGLVPPPARRQSQHPSKLLIGRGQADGLH